MEEQQVNFEDMSANQPPMPESPIPEENVIQIDPEVQKQLDTFDPMMLFQYLKDKQLLPPEMEPWTPGTEVEAEMPEQSPEMNQGEVSYDMMS